MFWLRMFLFAFPLGLVLAGMWLFQNVRHLEYERSDADLVTVIRESVGSLNPLVPLTGVTREVTDLLFEPMLTRDDDLQLRPNLVTSWNSQTFVTIRCAGDEEAEKAVEILEKIKATQKEGQTSDFAIQKVERKDVILMVTLEGFEPDLVATLLEKIPPELQGTFLLVKLRLKNSVQDSFETFLRSSVEKSQIRMLDYGGDSVANIFLQEGDETDLFIKELRLYYESNRNLEPEIEIVGNACHTSLREMVLRLRNDVRWHDGQLFSADDVLFSYEEMIRPGSMLPLAASFWYVERVEKIDQRSIRVVCLDAPAAILESWEKLPIVPAHILREKKNQAEWLEFFEKPVGNGPYRLESRLADGGISLRVNGDYFRSPPWQKRLVYRKLADREQRIRAIRFGEVDVVVPDERDLEWAERNPGYLRRVQCVPKFQNFIAWNLADPALQFPAVRRALAEAVDLSAILKDTPTTYQRPVESLFFPGAPYCKEPIFLPEFNVASAQRLLATAGYEEVGDSGVLMNENDRALAITLTVNKDNEEQMKLAAGVAKAWKKIGVTVELEPLAWGEILSEKLASRKFDAVVLGWELPYERDRFATWHSTQTGPEGGNFCGLNDPIVDQLLVKLRNEADEKVAAVAAGELQKKIAELQPYFFLSETGRLVTVRKDSMDMVRVRLDGKQKREPVNVGKSGIERVRPWWIRKSTPIEETATIQ